MSKGQSKKKKKKNGCERETKRMRTCATRKRYKDTGLEVVLYLIVTDDLERLTRESSRFQTLLLKPEIKALHLSC